MKKWTVKKILVLAVVVACAVVVVRVLAQPLVGESLNVVPIVSGSGSLHTTSEELVITNDTDYANFFGGAPPTFPTVNFGKEDVLAVTMGTQPAGSSVNITGLNIRTTGFTAGWGFVHVNEVFGSPITGGTFTTNGTVTITGGTTTNTGGTTSNTGGTFTVGTVFVGGVPQIQVTFTRGTTTITGGTTTSTGGTISWTTSSGTFTNTGGTATTTGDVTSTSATVTATGSLSSTSNPVVTGTATFTGNATTTGGTTIISGGTTTGGGGTIQPFSVVKVKKGALAYAFINDVTPTTYSGPTPFSSLYYTTGGGAAPFIDEITVDGSGNIIVNRSTSGTGGTNYLGTITLAESQALNTAFVNANPVTLPPIITDTTPANLTGIPSETLSSTIGSKVYTSIIDRAGFYNGSSSLEALVDAIRGPAERIVRGTLTDGFQGHVHFVGSDLRVGGSTIDPTDPFYNLIASAAGKNIAFDGLARGITTPVVSIDGILTANTRLLSFPSPGATVITTLPAGIHLDLTNFTLYGKYFEVKSGEQRGYVEEPAFDFTQSPRSFSDFHF